jgi:hypothetical protein
MFPVEPVTPEVAGSSVAPVARERPTNIGTSEAPPQTGQVGAALRADRLGQRSEKANERLSLHDEW